MSIKFNKHHVAANGKKARCHYHAGARTDGRVAVTIYSKDYGHALADVFAEAAEYKNDTDYMTDYFDKGRVVIFSDNPLYPAALERAQQNEAAAQARYAARR